MKCVTTCPQSSRRSFLSITVSLFKMTFAGALVVAGPSALAEGAPECLAHGQELGVNNEQVLHWKQSTENEFLARAHVTGQIVKIFNDKNGHNHFLIELGESRRGGDGDDTLEVVYNEEFGELPSLHDGMQVEACGDYITATGRGGKHGEYPPSPAGAIIHWVHANPQGHGHDSGYLMIDGQVYGLDDPDQGGHSRQRVSEAVHEL